MLSIFITSENVANYIRAIAQFFLAAKYFSPFMLQDCCKRLACVELVSRDTT